MGMVIPWTEDGTLVTMRPYAEQCWTIGGLYHIIYTSHQCLTIISMLKYAQLFRQSSTCIIMYIKATDKIAFNIVKKGDVASVDEIEHY